MQTVRKLNPNHRRGFTLLEVLIVVAIIAVIAALVVPNLLSNLSSSRERATQVDIKSIENTFKLYRVDHPTFPSGGSEVFEQLMLPEQDQTTGKQRPPTFEELPRDAWGNPFNYEYPSARFTNGLDKPAIWSNGANGQNDNGDNDDLNNWSSIQQ